VSPPRAVLAAIPLLAGYLAFVFVAFATDHGPVAVIATGVIVAAAGLLVAATVFPAVLGCTWRRHLRHRHPLEFYEVVLSTHDESRLGDVADMMEMLVGHTRAMRLQFARAGQSPVVVQSQCAVGASGRPEVVLQVGCLPGLAPVIESALHAAYPDVRLGWRESGAQRQPTRPLSFEPGAVSRWRKSRSFIHPVMPDQADESTPPLRAVMAAQAALGAPSVVRFTLVPAREVGERFARSRFRRYENRLERASRWGMREAGTRGRLASRELTVAAQALNRALAHCVIEVASLTDADTDRIGSALRAHRGSNRLYSETLIRRRAALRRFHDGRTPVLLDVTLRRLFSTPELAYLLVLPGAEAKDVPLRRLKRPMLPVSPGALTPAEGTPGWSDAQGVAVPTATVWADGEIDTPGGNDGI
jgi:hypothetical protein